MGAVAVRSRGGRSVNYFNAARALGFKMYFECSENGTVARAIRRHPVTGEVEEFALARCTSLDYVARAALQNVYR